MDLNQQLELKSNQPSQNSHRSRMCYSRLADALTYAELTGQETCVERSSERKPTGTRSPEREPYYIVRSPRREEIIARSPGRDASVLKSPRRPIVKRSPRSDNSYVEIPIRAVSDNSMSVDGKLNVSRTASATDKMYIPTPTRLDLVSVIGSGLSSPESSVFAMAYRFDDSPPPFTARQLPPIKGRQEEKELNLKQQHLDNIKNQNMFEERNGDPKTSDVTEKQGKDDVQKVEPIVQKENNTINKNDSQHTQTLTDVNDKVNLPPQKKPGQPNVPVSTPKSPKPRQPKGHIVVHETKSSRLRQNQLQIQNDQPDVTQLLTPVTTPTKNSARPTVSPTELPKPRSANFVLRTSASPVHAVRETKTSKLRRLKKIEDEKEAMRQEEQDRLKDMASERQHERLLQRKRSPTPTFKPAPPKPYKTPEPVAIKETRASKLRGGKKPENKLPVKIIKTSKEPQRPPHRSPTPTFKPVPPKPYKIPAPVAIRETRASKLRKLIDVKTTGNQLPGKRIKPSNGPQRRTLEQCHEITSSNANKSQASSSSKIRGTGQISSEMKKAETPMVPHPLPPISQSATENTIGSQRETTPAVLRELRESRKLHERYIEDEDLVATPRVKWSCSRTLLWLVDNPDCSEQLSDTVSSNPETKVASTPQTEVWNGEFDPEAIKYFRSLTPVEIEWKPPPEKRILSPIARIGDGFISNPVSPSWRIESALMTSTPIPRPPEIKQLTEKEQEVLDRSERDRLCRKEISRGFKVRKQIRMAMDEEEKQWKSEIISEINIVEDASSYVQRPVNTNKKMVQKELDALKERLKRVEATDKTVKSSSLGSKFKTYFKSKVENNNDKIKRERKEKIDEHFKISKDELSRQMCNDWRTFILQQNCHHEMLKKARQQEEMIYHWKSDAIRYKNLHTMLKTDYLEGRKESWYI